MHDDYEDEDEITREEATQQFENLTLSPEPLETSPTDSSSIWSPSTFGTASSLSGAPPTSPAQSKWKTAFDEVRHFAGGLVSHPYESTKHYSILRHSHGVVYYKGPYTNLAITIFSDRPLPADRTLWLQRRGFSGKTGLKIGASFVGLKSAWINVTPSVTAVAEDLLPTDERAWQRDIAKFLKKAPKDLRRHQVRETDVLRIPATAEDGYLRVVLCAGERGKKVLCPSPVFRLFSTKFSPSSIRGASFGTLPLELSLKIGSVVANSMAHNAVSPVTSAISSQVQAFQPGFMATHAASAAYDMSLKDKISNANMKYDRSQEELFQPTTAAAREALARPDFVGRESGPEPPFPLRFHGKVVPGNGWSRAALGMPTANLSGVPQEVLLRNEGVYFGWVSITTNDKNLREELPDYWLEAVISFIPRQDAKLKVVLHKEVRVYVIYDFQDLSLIDCHISIMLMGFLRQSKKLDIADGSVDREAVMLDIYRDTTITQASLGRPAWSAEATLDRIKSGKSNRSLSDRYVEVRTGGQKQLDRVPLHWAGVRSNHARLQDHLFGTGGVCVLR